MLLLAPAGLLAKLIEGNPERAEARPAQTPFAPCDSSGTKMHMSVASTSLAQTCGDPGTFSDHRLWLRRGAWTPSLPRWVLIRTKSSCTASAASRTSRCPVASASAGPSCPRPILPSFLVLADACLGMFAGSNMGANLSGCMEKTRTDPCFKNTARIVFSVFATGRSPPVW